ncbi:phosphotransferase family protein [Paenibacillus sp. Marseille-Q7038]
MQQNTIQKMLSRWDLGTLHSYKPTEHGVMKQTLFIHTSTGDYVFKGNPLYPGQWEEEQFMIQQLKQHTKAPVPTPYVIDSAEDLFGYSYVIMPLLPGVHYHDLDKLTLSEAKHKLILSKLAAALHELHTWKTMIAGEYDPETEDIRSFEQGFYPFFEQQILYWLEDARKYSPIEDADINWVREKISVAASSFYDIDTYSFVMGDYKSENILIQQNEGEWEVSGIIDFTTAYFGDPLADVVKFTNQLLWKGQQKKARFFLSSYLQNADLPSTPYDISSRLSIHFLYSLILRWGEIHATGQIDNKNPSTFREFASHHLDIVASIY